MAIVDGACVTSQSLQEHGVEAELLTYGSRHGHWLSSHHLASCTYSPPFLKTLVLASMIVADGSSVNSGPDRV